MRPVFVLTTWLMAIMVFVSVAGVQSSAFALTASASTTVRVVANTSKERALARRQARVNRRLGRPAVRSSTSSIPSFGICGNGKMEAKEQCDDGNTQDGDGCSSICIVVPEPVYHSLLQVEQTAAGTLSTSAQGQKGLTLMKFTVTSGRQDAVLTRLAFTAAGGSLSYGQKYALLLDANSDGTYETVVDGRGRANSTTLDFGDFAGGGIRIPQGKRMPFLVRVDLPATIGAVSMGLRFATEEDDYVQAHGFIDGTQLTGIETDGNCSGLCMIQVHTRSTTSIDVQERGTLFVALDSTPVCNRQVLLGTLSEPLLRLRLHAESEDIELTSLRFDGIVSSIEALAIYRLVPGEVLDPNRTLPIARATQSQCPTVSATRFCATMSHRLLVVSPLQDSVLAIIAQTNNDELGGISGQSFALGLSADTGVNHAVEARGLGSDQVLVQNDGDAQIEGEIVIGRLSIGNNGSITGPTHDTLLAAIGSISNGLPLRSEDTVPVGTAVIGAFTLSALAHNNRFHGQNDVIVQAMDFHVTAQNVSIDASSWKLTNPDNQDVTLACSANSTTGSIDVRCSGIASSIIQKRILQGQAATYMLKATITSNALSQGAGSILAVDLPTLGQRGVSNSITFSDEVTTFTWVDVPQTSVSSTIFRIR